MNGKMIVRVVVGLIVIALLVGAGIAIYKAGVAQGLLLGDKLPLPAAGTVPARVWGAPYAHRPFGFGVLGCLAPLFFLLLVFAFIRMTFGGWRRHWGHHGGCGHPGMARDIPPMVAEWHRRLHEAEPKADAPQPGAK